MRDFLSNNESCVLGYAKNPQLSGFLWYDVVDSELTSKKRNLQLPYINVLKIFEAVGIKAFFRGHQHSGAGLKLCSDYAHEPVGWDGSEQPVKIGSSCPIFTFTTATEHGEAKDVFYGIVKTNVDFEKWSLIPHLVERKK